MKASKKLKKSLGRYAYWNFLFGKKKTMAPKEIGFEMASNCQAACAPGDPCSAAPTCSMD